ncbi:MAG: hypothetical protein K2P99_02400, partial [Burkholderiales bacterium]|nr:hypothetical protein [Burkholderiales bacterium]
AEGAAAGGVEAGGVAAAEGAEAAGAAATGAATGVATLGQSFSKGLNFIIEAGWVGLTVAQLGYKYDQTGSLDAFDFITSLPVLTPVAVKILQKIIKFMMMGKIASRANQAMETSITNTRSEVTSIASRRTTISELEEVSDLSSMTSEGSSTTSEGSSTTSEGSSSISELEEVTNPTVTVIAQQPPIFDLASLRVFASIRSKVRVGYSNNLPQISLFHILNYIKKRATKMFILNNLGFR